MINKNYSYENIGLYEQEVWKDRYSIVCPLATWIGKKNNGLIRNKAKLGIYHNRTDGVFDSKTQSVFYQDVIKYWDEKGLFYKCTEMAGVCWIAMVPHKVKDGKEKNPKIMVVLHDADYTDKNWAMDTVQFYDKYNGLAAREEMVILYVVSDGLDEHNIYISILQELSVIFHFNIDKVYIDLSTVFLAGSKLNEIPGFIYKDAYGKVISNRDDSIEYFEDIPVLDITGRWQNRVSGLINIISEQAAHRGFAENLIHSIGGKKIADAIKLEYTYQYPESAEFLEHWGNMGLRYESHNKNGEQWITLAPLCAYEKSEDKLPVMLIFAEVNYVNKFRAISALTAFHEYIDLAAQGELMLIFFALETPDDNDLFYDILQEAAEIYPIDRSRVYITGHSHNGHFAMEFIRHHHVDALQRRLKACNCTEKSFEEIVAARTSSDYATRMIGIPNDRSEIKYKLGCECYIADVKNKEGKYHLRLVTIAKMPHMPSPQMPELSWEFIRRFARDLETGKVIELY